MQELNAFISTDFEQSQKKIQNDQLVNEKISNLQQTTKTNRISIKDQYANFQDNEIGKLLDNGCKRNQKQLIQKRQKKKQNCDVKISDSQQLIQDIQHIKQLTKKEECILCRKEEFKQATNIESLRSFLLIICRNFEFPQSQHVVDFIKKITGKILYEDSETYHKQYDRGVMINLNHQIFDYQKLLSLMDYVIDLILDQDQNKLTEQVKLCLQHNEQKYIKNRSSQNNSSIQQNWLQQNFQQLRNDTTDIGKVVESMKQQMQI